MDWARIGLVAAVVGWGLAASASGESFRLYIGTYTGAESKGIYLSRFDAQTGKLSPAELAAEVPSPSFLAIAPGGKFVYAVSEIGDFEGKKTGAVAALAVDPVTGKLTLLNKQPSAGAGPCHVTVDQSGRHVLVANYGGGSVASLPIAPDGRLGPATSAIQHQGKSVNPQRQEGPHGHSINLDAAGRFALAADLGLDQVLVYRFDAQRGTLTPHDPPAAHLAPGAGPRHFAFHPNGRYAYVINELASTVTAFVYDAAAGTLRQLQTISTLPQEVPGNSTADIHVHPSGKFLYGSNRGHDSIAVFRVDPASGKLTAAGHQKTGGRTPRNFSLDPTGKFLLAANQDSNDVTVFRIDPATGALAPTGERLQVGRPVCLQFVVAAK